MLSLGNYLLFGLLVCIVLVYIMLVIMLEIVLYVWLVGSFLLCISSVQCLGVLGLLLGPPHVTAGSRWRAA